MRNPTQGSRVGAAVGYIPEPTMHREGLLSMWEGCSETKLGPASSPLTVDFPPPFLAAANTYKHRLQKRSMRPTRRSRPSMAH
jgi:hypothetical protein